MDIVDPTRVRLFFSWLRTIPRGFKEVPGTLGILLSAATRKPAAGLEWTCAVVALSCRGLVGAGPWM